MIIRAYKKEDKERIVKLFYETVHTVNLRDYNPKQLDAWAPRSIDPEQWCVAFETDYTLVAEIEQKIVGFANIDRTGYFDRLYVHKDYQGKGIAKMISAEIENYAQKNNLSKILVDSSITAKPFFQNRGYEILKENAVKRCGQILINYTMRKYL